VTRVINSHQIITSTIDKRGNKRLTFDCPLRPMREQCKIFMYSRTFAVICICALLPTQSALIHHWTVLLKASSVQSVDQSTSHSFLFLWSLGFFSRAFKESLRFAFTTTGSKTLCCILCRLGLASPRRVRCARRSRGNKTGKKRVEPRAADIEILFRNSTFVDYTERIDIQRSWPQ
jgi:hypothetical protein